MSEELLMIDDLRNGFSSLGSILLRWFCLFLLVVGYFTLKAGAEMIPGEPGLKRLVMDFRSGLADLDECYKNAKVMER